jgi:hypothetical protein
VFAGPGEDGLALLPKYSGSPHTACTIAGDADWLRALVVDPEREVAAVGALDRLGWSRTTGQRHDTRKEKPSHRDGKAENGVRHNLHNFLGCVMAGFASDMPLCCERCGGLDLKLPSRHGKQRQRV